MKQKNSDQEILEALNFSNLILLDQSFSFINFSTINKNNLYSKEYYSGTQNKNKIKSKFERVGSSKNQIDSKKSKQNSDQSNLYLNYNVIESKYPVQINSKVQINSNVLDQFQSAGTFQHITFELPNKFVQSQLYTVEQMLKTTAVKGKQQSPINKWKSKTIDFKQQINQLENPFKKVFLNDKATSYSTSNHTISSNYTTSAHLKPDHVQISGLSKNESQLSDINSLSFNKILKTKSGVSKFEKPLKKKDKDISFSKTQQPQQSKPSKIIKQKQNTGFPSPSIFEQDSLAIDLQYIYPKKQLLNGKPLNELQYSKIFDPLSQRDTCQLAPSKLQKLIEVEDNKYKQMILKTFYKHQK